MAAYGRSPGRKHSPVTRGSQLSDSDYSIDYDELDVADVVAQIRERSRRGSSASANLPEVVQERSRARVRAAVDLDDQLPYELQRTLQLQGTWNVTPRDLVASERRGAGSVLTAIRRGARPVLKLFANFELPLYKQFKINLGMAALLNELLNRTAELEGQLDDAHRRIEHLEARRTTDEPDLG